jgi:hypothetical protein
VLNSGNDFSSAKPAFEIPQRLARRFPFAASAAPLGATHSRERSALTRPDKISLKHWQTTIFDVARKNRK